MVVVRKDGVPAAGEGAEGPTMAVAATMRSLALPPEAIRGGVASLQGLDRLRDCCPRRLACS
jgi:hypothetical protein